MKPLGDRADGRAWQYARRQTAPIAADRPFCCRCCSRARACSPSRRAPHAGLYKWIDERGVVHYSDKMPAGRRQSREPRVEQAGPDGQQDRAGAAVDAAACAKTESDEQRMRQARARQAAGRAARPRAGRVVHERGARSTSRSRARWRRSTARCSRRRPTSRRCRSGATSSRARRARTRHARSPARSCAKSRRSTRDRAAERFHRGEEEGSRERRRALRRRQAAVPRAA